MSTYSADISVKVVGREKLDKLEQQLARIDKLRNQLTKKVALTVDTSSIDAALKRIETRIRGVNRTIRIRTIEDRVINTRNGSRSESGNRGGGNGGGAGMSPLVSAAALAGVTARSQRELTKAITTSLSQALQPPTRARAIGSIISSPKALGSSSSSSPQALGSRPIDYAARDALAGKVAGDALRGTLRSGSLDVTASSVTVQGRGAAVAAATAGPFRTSYQPNAYRFPAQRPSDNAFYDRWRYRQTDRGPGSLFMGAQPARTNGLGRQLSEFHIARESGKGSLTELQAELQKFFLTAEKGVLTFSGLTPRLNKIYQRQLEAMKLPYQLTDGGFRMQLPLRSQLTNNRSAGPFVPPMAGPMAPRTLLQRYQQGSIGLFGSRTGAAGGGGGRRPPAAPPVGPGGPGGRGGLGAAAGAGLAFANIPGQSIVQSAAAGALVAGPKGAIAAGLVATGVAAVQAGDRIAKFYAEVAKGRQALAGISTSNADYAASLKGIESVVRDFNAPIAETTSNFTKLRAATAAVGLDAAETTKVYRALAAANVALGGDSERLQGILLATSQIFSKGKVTAEELRGQLGERLAGAFADFARAGGQSTAQLDAALQKGEVSLEDFLKFTDYAAKKYEKNAMALADSSVSAGDRLTKAWQNLQVAIGPLLQDIGAKFQNFATSVVNFLTPVIAKVTELLGLTRQAQNDRLFNVRAEIAKIDETLRKIPEGQRRISAGLQDANGNLIGAGVDVGARLRAERAALVKEEQRLSATLNQKTGGQQVSKNITLTNTDQQEKDRKDALEKELGIRSELRQLAIQQTEIDTAAGLIGKDRLSQLYAQGDAMKEILRLTVADIRQSDADPRIKTAQQGLAISEFQREGKQINDEIDKIIEEINQLGVEGANMRRELLGGQMQVTETPLQTAIRETKEELLDADQAALALLDRLNKLAGTNPEGSAVRNLIGNLRGDIAATDPKKLASQKLAQSDISGLEEQKRLLEQQITALSQGRTELTGMEQLMQRYGADWANLDATVKGHLVGLARTNDALAEQLEKMQQLRADAEALGGITVNGIQDALVASVTGGDVRAAFGSLFEQLGSQFLSMAFRPIQEMLVQEIAKLLGLSVVDAAQTAAVAANTGAVTAAATAISTTVVPTVTANTTAVAALTTAVVANTAAQSAGSATSALGGFGSSILGGLGSLFGGGGGLGAAASSVSFNPIAFTPGLSFLASGGPMDAGKPYIVGEEGPELILPKQSGYVFNARETEDALAESRRALSGRGAESETSAFNENKEMLATVTNNIATRVAEASQSNRAPVQVEYRGPQLNFNGDDYLPKDAAVAIIEEASQRGARLGHQRTMGQLKNNPGARRTIGI